MDVCRERMQWLLSALVAIPLTLLSARLFLNAIPTEKRWAPYPAPGDVPVGLRDKPGAQVLRKDTAAGPWLVDHEFPAGCMRVEGLVSFAFTTDWEGKALPKPARLLLASPSELRSPQAASSVFVRNDATGQWVCSDIAPGNLGARSFGSHVDKLTGVHHLFAGLNRGGIHRGSHAPESPGGIRWGPQPERTAAALPGKGRYDAAHPVPAGHKLTGCRDIEPSPFPGEQGRVFYFCGYDGGAGPSHNTAWIYKGTLEEKP